MAISNKINEALSPTNKRFNIKFILAEVFLITAGILIALAIDNWNTDRAEQEMIEKYLIQMHKEFYNEIDRIEGERKQFYKSSLDKNLRALKIIKNNQIDSISVLEKLLVGISNPLSTSANIPITKEFLKQNLLYKIKNENLKNELKMFPTYLEGNDYLIDFETNQYINTIEPFVTSNMNYTQLLTSYRKPYMVDGGPKTDFKRLMKGYELWNIVSYKREWLLAYSGALDGIGFVLNKLKKEIENELGDKLTIKNQ
ncbi:MAG: hypothetical protein CMC04_08210 [Flavobacteriaceae bacterium]|nr:hypothetical protein [Flavobacteriaceae bacterium]|tara:strand:+ start:73 stop:840 length:768 start_codon:yes stop_codon:yes gene_type:complete